MPNAREIKKLGKEARKAIDGQTLSPSATAECTKLALDVVNLWTEVVNEIRKNNPSSADRRGHLHVVDNKTRELTQRETAQVEAEIKKTRNVWTINSKSVSVKVGVQL